MTADLNLRGVRGRNAGVRAGWLGARPRRRMGRVSPIWLTLIYFVHTLGELCLSPVGLSLVTKISPKKVVGR